jgi:deoxyuridine 5'-triphosphate nucleotidohydrolase
MDSFLNLPESERAIMAEMTKEWINDVLPTLEKSYKNKQPILHEKNIALLEARTVSSNEETIEVKFVKTHPNAQLPSKAYSDGDNCFDLYCCEDTEVPPTQTTSPKMDLKALYAEGYHVKVGTALVPVGLKVAYITPGFGFVVKDKSGLGFKHQLSHYGGEIDNGYRGDMGIKIANYSDVPYTFRKGDKVAQIKIEKIWKTEISFVDEIVPVNCPRGEGGFGSSGK